MSSLTFIFSLLLSCFLLFLSLALPPWCLCSNLVSVCLSLSLHALWKPINPISHIWVSPDKSIASPSVSMCECVCHEDQHMTVSQVCSPYTHTHIHNIPGLLPWRWIKAQPVPCLNDRHRTASPCVCLNVMCVCPCTYFECVCVRGVCVWQDLSGSCR